MRVTVPSSEFATQTAPLPNTIPVAPFPTGIVRTTAGPLALIWVTVAVSPLATQTDPSPIAIPSGRPATGSTSVCPPPGLTLDTVPSSVFATHTAPYPVAIDAGPFPTAISLPTTLLAPGLIRSTARLEKSLTQTRPKPVATPEGMPCRGCDNAAPVPGLHARHGAVERVCDPRRAVADRDRLRPVADGGLADELPAGRVDRAQAVGAYVRRGRRAATAHLDGHHGGNHEQGERRDGRKHVPAATVGCGAVRRLRHLERELDLEDAQRLLEPFEAPPSAIEIRELVDATSQVREALCQQHLAGLPRSSTAGPPR